MPRPPRKAPRQGRKQASRREWVVTSDPAMAVGGSPTEPMLWKDQVQWLKGLNVLSEPRSPGYFGRKEKYVS